MGREQKSCTSTGDDLVLPWSLFLADQQHRQFVSLSNTSVTMMSFKVKEVAENMLTPSTVGSFTLMKNPIRKKSKIR